VNADIIEEIHFRTFKGDGNQNPVHLVHLFWAVMEAKAAAELCAIYLTFQAPAPRDMSRMFGAFQFPYFGAVELGCYKGATAAFLTKCIMYAMNTGNVLTGDRWELHVYDSFEGLPEHSPEDFGTKSLAAQGQVCASQDDVIETFAARFGLPHGHAGKPLPIIHPGWFAETLPAQLPKYIAFAHLDGDLYSSIKISLEHVWPRMIPGGVIVIDDYNFLSIPGCKRAADEFFADKHEKPESLFGSVQAIVRKLA
jgi:O-methyltransferase